MIYCLYREGDPMENINAKMDEQLKTRVKELNPVSYTHLTLPTIA